MIVVGRTGGSGAERRPPEREGIAQKLNSPVIP